jgi:hypothetical protein
MAFKAHQEINMIAPPLLSSTTDSPLLLGEEIEVRSTDKAVETMKLTKKQIEVTMFAAGVEKLEGLKVGKLIER